MTSSTLFVDKIVMDADERRRRLGRVYKLLIDLARQKDSAVKCDGAESVQMEG